jgi:thiol-disulfide isomerase/thioredoxin
VRPVVSRSSFVAALLLGAVSACAPAALRERPSAAVGAPLSLRVPDLEGRPYELLAGSPKVVVVHFWASWCEPCVVALPLVDGLARRYAPRGVRVVGVTIDTERPAVDAFLAAHPVSFPILWDRAGEALDRLDASIMPVSFVLDARGVVRHVLQGWPAGSLEREQALVEELLRTP